MSRHPLLRSSDHEVIALFLPDRPDQLVDDPLLQTRLVDGALVRDDEDGGWWVMAAHHLTAFHRLRARGPASGGATPRSPRPS